MTVQGLIFDLDGVLTDTAEYHYLAWKQLAEEQGIEFSRQDNEQLRGVSRRESLLRLLKGKVIPEATLQEWMHLKNEYYKSYLDEITPEALLPGVADFLDNAKSNNLKLAVGSASKNAKSVLEKLNIVNMFDVIGDGYSVVNTKPAPDLFIWVAGGLQAYVCNVVVFEDARAGIQAAKAAGCGTVGIGTTEVQDADIIVEGFTDITLNHVLEKFSA